jgi:hypothetical protein
MTVQFINLNQALRKFFQAVLDCFPGEVVLESLHQQLIPHEQMGAPQGSQEGRKRTRVRRCSHHGLHDGRLQACMVDVLPVQVIPPPAQIEKIDDGIARQFSIDKGYCRVAADLPREELIPRLPAENVRKGPDGRELMSQVE